MHTEQQLKALDKYVDVIYELMVDQITAIELGPSDANQYRLINNHRSIFVRMFGQLLYEAPKLHTGKVSIRLIEQKLQDFSTRPCFEHHQSRQKGGRSIVAMIDQSVANKTLPNRRLLHGLVMLHCQVHYTTAEENALLRKHQRRCSSEAAYRRAQITLVEAEELFTQRGRHSAEWKQAMREKYQPIVDAYYNPVIADKQIPEMPLVIN